MSVYRAFFSGVDSTGARQLWVTDGTAAGTTELAVTNAAATGLAPLGLTNFGNSILFEGTDAAGDYNLYISGGTAAGTTELTSAGANDVGLFGFVQLGPHGSTLIRPYVPQPFTVIGKSPSSPRSTQTTRCSSGARTAPARGHTRCRWPATRAADLTRPIS